MSEPVAVFLKAADDNGVPVDVLDVPNGQHGFDMLDHTDESRQAVEKAATWITERLGGQR